MSDLVYHQFFSLSPSVQTVTPKGKVIAFMGGRYVTTDKDEIAYLQELAASSQYITVKEEEATVTQAALDPIQALRRKIMEELKAEQAAQVDGSRDMGSYQQPAMQPQSSKDVQATTVGSLHAKIAASLKAK